MAHQSGVALCQILPRIGRQIAERRRQAVDAMLPRHAAERPQGVLQALGQGDEAFAAEYDMGMLEAGQRQPEVIEPSLTRDGDAERARAGEVGQTQAAGLVLLAEDHVLFGAVEPRQALMRRSSVRRMLGARSGCRRRSSSSTPITRMPGAAFRIGTISVSQ